MRKRVTSMAALVALASALLVNGATVAQAATNYNISVGAPIGGSACNPGAGQFDDCWAESMRFLPDRLTVHKGDTLTFTGGFHTATALPANADAQDWVDKNATNLGSPYTFLAPNVDDPDNPAKLNNLAALPPSDCGVPEAPCDYTGDAVVNSGALPFGPGAFTMTVNADPGDVFWVVCLIHTHMRMKVTVVADAAAASQQSSLDSAAAQTLAEDTELAQAVDAKLNKPSSHTVDGHKVQDAFAGYDTHNVTLYRMYPHKLKVARNSTVRWHFSELVYEIHSVTFPESEALAVANDFGNTPSCDPDGAGSAPNNPPEMAAPPFCNDPTQLEFLVTGRGIFPQGDGVLKSATDFENSGVRGVDLAAPTQGHAPYDLKFAKSSTKPYKYICLVHPFMRGSVLVK
ncbi:MAG: hypothetical protein QOK47_379 [Actinomycetota bacterium]|nr:hypothetical protein [Actinomycetota bacterium]